MSEMDDERAREARAGGERAAPPPRLACDDAEPASPRLVTRGESFSPSDTTTTHPYAAITDYLTVTFPFPLGEPGISPFFIELCSAIGIGLGMLNERRGGMLGFKRSYAFERHGAVFAFGGQNGKAMLSLPGAACAVIEDWHAFAFFLQSRIQARITRWDGAVDDFEGRRTVNDAVRWFCEGGFTAGGNAPLPRQEGNWLTADAKGRTFYVGKRGNGKLMRVYEKGKQLGDPNSPWVRFGRAWVFVEQLLLDTLVSKSTARVSVVDRQETTECRSTDARTHPVGGSNSRPFAASRSLYSKALGLPTSGRRSKSTTSSPPPDGSKTGSA